MLCIDDFMQGCSKYIVSHLYNIQVYQCGVDGTFAIILNDFGYEIRIKHISLDLLTVDKYNHTEDNIKL